MIFTVLPTNKLELYAAVKKICYIDNGRKFWITISISENRFL
jgi:hypothetical protein